MKMKNTLTAALLLSAITAGAGQQAGSRQETHLQPVTLAVAGMT